MDYMGIFVEVNVEPLRSCSTCEYQFAIDRHECNECAREWNNSHYTKFIGWKPKIIIVKDNYNGSK